VITERTRLQQSDYESAIAKAGGSLESRAKALAKARTAEGYMAEVTKLSKEESDLLLIEHHCPICEAAEACVGFCRAELSVFQAVLGEDVSVERTEHLLAGQPRCAYRIRPLTEADRLAAATATATAAAAAAATAAAAPDGAAAPAPVTQTG